MGNCIGRKSSKQTKHRENDECRLQTSSTLSLSNESIILVSYPSEEINCTRSFVDNDENSSMDFSFTRDKLIIESIDSSLSNSSFSTFSPPSTSFSSQDHLLLSSSTSCLSFDQFHLSLNSNHFITHSHQTLRSIIHEHLQQQSIHLHRQTNTILIEHKLFQCLPLKNLDEYVYSSTSPCLIAYLTWNLIQICLNEKNHHDLFGFISRRHTNSLEQILLDRSKYQSTNILYLQITKFYLVRALEYWPEEIRLNYENRTRLWPLNYEHFFDKTCFIRYKKIQETNQTFSSYTYTAIEHQLILSMSNEQKYFASKLWNYLNVKTDGHLNYRIFKHTIFYFFENYSSEVYRIRDLSNYISKFIDFFLYRLEKQSFPHYFNTNRNLYTNEISSSIRMIYSDTRISSCSYLPIRSNYLLKFFYLIEFQSKFFINFQLSRTSLLTQTILQTHESIRKQIDFNYPLDLDRLYQYQENNIQIILDYLSFIREKESSLIIHTYWSLFIQYFNSLFDDVFIS